MIRDINKYEPRESLNLIRGLAGDVIGGYGFDIIPINGEIYCSGLITSVNASKVFTFADDADDDTANVEGGLAVGTEIILYDTDLYDGTHTITAISGTSVTLGNIGSTAVKTFRSTARWSLTTHDFWAAIVPVGTTISSAYLVKARSRIGDSLTLTGVYPTGGNVALVHGGAAVGQFDAIINGNSTAGMVLCAIRG